MTTQRRYTIHVPQLVGRLSAPRHGEDSEQAMHRLVGEWDGAMQELQRFLRYLTNANDSAQEGAGIDGVVDGTVDHGSIGGLGDDDHTQYIRVDGTRPFTGDQSMGQNSLTQVEVLGFDTTPTTPADADGELSWNATDRTLDLVLDYANSVTLQVGQEQLIRVLNNTGAPLLNGRAVKITGASGQRVTVDYADNTVHDDIHYCIGVLTQDIPNNEQGFVTREGLVRNVNTIGLADGERLWLSTSGQLTNSQPIEPAALLRVAIVVNGGSGGAGIIFVELNEYKRLGELSNVVISSPQNLESLNYDSASATWKNNEVFHRKHGFEVSSAGAALVTITYDAATRKITVTPTGASFDFWIDGVKFTKTGAQTSGAHTATTGNWFFTYDSTGALQVSSSPWSVLDRTSTPVALIYYHASLAAGVCFYECHTADRVLEFHYNLHHSRGTQYISGGDLTGYTLNLDTDAGVTYAISEAIIADEDIRRTCGPTADGGPYTIFWRDGATGVWTWTDVDTFPFKYGGTYPSYNQWTGATWQLTELSGLGLGQWVNYYVFAVPAVNATHQLVILPGQSLYTSLATAQSASVASDIDPGGAVFPFQEIKSIWKITLHALNTFGGTHKTRIEAVASVKRENIVLSATGAGGITDHGALTGLGDDDHAQYLLEDGTRALSANWDAGPWEIRAETLESDVAAGTAPLTVASNTKVTNLNADLVDGEEASAFEHVANKGAASGYASLDASQVVNEAVKLYRQGLEAALPALAEGELYWATDTDTLYVGT